MSFMTQRNPARLDDETVLYEAVTALAREGYGRDVIEKALIAYAPVDLDLLADCYVRVLRDITRTAASPAVKVA